jgi:uncharacterized protein
MARTVTVHSRARVVCPSCTVADSVGTRLRGLMGRKALAPGDGLLLRPSGSVHTCFMRFEIDVVFLDRDLEVVGVAPSVRPWRVRARRGARAVLELAGGEAARLEIRPGDQLELTDPATIDKEEEVHALC